MSEYKTILFALSQNKRKVTWLVLNLIPLLLMVLFVLIWTQNVPFKHDWVFLKHILKYSPDEWLSNFWRPQNGQRNIFPQLIYLVDYYLFSFNTLYITYLNLIILLVSYYIIWKIFRQELLISWKEFLPVSWLFFCLVQYGNVLITWQISLNLSIMSSLISLYFLNQTTSKSLILSILFAVISVGSFGNGLVILPLGVFYLILNKRAKNRIAYWSVFSVLLLIIYFTNYARSGVSFPFSLISASLFFTNLVSMATLLPFGRLGGVFYSISFLMGSILILAALIQFITYFRGIKRKGAFSMIAILFIYVIGIFGEITLGRSGTDIKTAYATQYTTFAVLFLIFLYGLVLLTKKNTTSVLGVQVPIKISKAIVFTIIILTIIIGNSYGLIMGPYLYGRSLIEKSILLNFEHHPDHVKAFISGATNDDITQMISIMTKQNKSIFDNKEVVNNTVLLPFLETVPLREEDNLIPYLQDSASFNLVNTIKVLENISLKTKISEPSHDDSLTVSFRGRKELIYSKSILSADAFKMGRAFFELDPPIDISQYDQINITVLKNGNTLNIPLYQPYYRGPICIEDTTYNFDNCLVPGLELNTPSRLKYFYMVDALRSKAKYFIKKKKNDK